MTISLRRSSLAAACAAALTACAFAADPTQDTLPTVKKNISDEKAVLVDVREKAEWDRGHVDGAIFLPLSELRKGIDTESLTKKLPAERIIYTHCAVGVRSCAAADLLVKFGYDVRPLKPGYKELLKAGFKKAEQ